METQLSTDAVAPAERIAYWNDAICSAFVRLDLDCDRRLPFQSELGIRKAATFDLISDDEYRAGLERAETELPDQVNYRQEWLIAAAEAA